MAFSINTNVASLQAQNYLRISSDFQSKTINEVTSGLRIVQSGDDAAGLAIANGYRSDGAVLTQGIQNANNGLSQLQIIDGGMNNISQLLDRARTLATESATGTFTGDRNVLNSEFQNVLTEINRQAQSIGLNTGGTFAKALSVFVGGGKGDTGAEAIQNGSISLDLSHSTIDSKSLGLEGVQATGLAGTDIGTGSPNTSVAQILTDPANTTNTAGYSTFYISGPGFSGAQKIQVQANLSAVTDANTLVSAINDAIQNAGNATTPAATAFKNANITASATTDPQGRTQIAFASSNTSFQVQAGDQMANALMGNFGAKAVMIGTAGGAFTTTGATDDYLTLSFDGGPAMNFHIGVVTGVTAGTVATDLNAVSAFAANAVASSLGGKLVITSLNDSANSTITVTDTTLSTNLGLTGTATAPASTGKSLGETVTATLGATGTASVVGAIVRIQGGGMAGPVDLTLASTDTAQALAVADLISQANNNAALRTAGISVTSTGGKLIFSSASGQGFNVSAVGDTTNSLGLGNYRANGSFFEYTSITGAATATGAVSDKLEISVAGATPQEITVTGTGGDTTTTLVNQLNTALASNKYLAAAGIHASVSGTSITLSSTNGTAFRVAEGTGTAANQILGFGSGAVSNLLTVGDVNYTGGDQGSFAAVPSSTTNDIYFAAGGSAATSPMQFSPILNGQDDQTVTVSANDASGSDHSLAVVLANNATARNARSLDEAITAINTALQQSNDPTLSKIVAVRSDLVNANGAVTGEGIRFLSALPSFSVTLSAAGSGTPVGIGNATEQGTVQKSTQLPGGGSADISNQTSAEAAVTALAAAVTALGAAQAVVGRGENQFAYAVNLAQSQLTNLAAAESAIRDADMAAAAANLTKAQILVQAGVAALAQANSAPQQVLSLLRQQ